MSVENFNLRSERAQSLCHNVYLQIMESKYVDVLIFISWYHCCCSFHFISFICIIKVNSSIAVTKQKNSNRPICNCSNNKCIHIFLFVFRSYFNTQLLPNVHKKYTLVRMHARTLDFMTMVLRVVMPWKKVNSRSNF